MCVCFLLRHVCCFGSQHEIDKFTKLYNEPERCVKQYTKLYAVLPELRKVANSSKLVKVRKGNIKVA